MQAYPMISVERSDQTLILAPEGDVGAFAEGEIEAEMPDLLKLLDEPGVSHLVVDLRAAPYFGSTMLSAIVRLGKHLRQRGGRMALCNVSCNALDVLHVTKLNRLWPICSSMSEALAIVSR